MSLFLLGRGEMVAKRLMAGETLLSHRLAREAPTAPHFICALAERGLNLVMELNCDRVVPAARLHLLSPSTRWSFQAAQEAHALHLHTSGPDEVGPQVPGYQCVGQSFGPDQGLLLGLSSMPCPWGWAGPWEGP